MPDYHVIENVSETLQEFVTNALKVINPNQPPKAELHDLHTPPVSQEEANSIVAITLVEVREDPTSRNRSRVHPESQRSGGAPLRRLATTKPPMALRLRYLMTPWSSPVNAIQIEQRLLEHRMLGCIARLFYDQAILSGAMLKGFGESPPNDPQLHLGLEGSDQSLIVTLAQLSFEEQTRFWHVVQQKYRPSLTYDVRVVNLDSNKQVDSALVSSREIEYGRLSS